MMLKGKDIICVSFPNWEGDYMKTIVQVMTIFGKSNRVLYVDYEYTWKDVLFYFLGKQKLPIQRVLGLKNRLRKELIDENNHVFVLSPPPIFPINWISHPKIYRFLLKINSKIVEKSIQKQISELDMNAPIIINAFNPFMGVDMVGSFKESLLLYYCYDEINAALWSKNHGKIIEKEFLKKVDVVITTSKGLQDTKKQDNQACYLVKNGVDFSLFSKGISLQKYKNKQIIGYVGSIDDRLDYDLLHFCVENAPHLFFVFVGRVMNEKLVEKLKTYSTVEFVGSKSPQELPSYLASFDVGIIPFVKNEFTKNIYPLKINEYLAAGAGVVMTNFGDLAEFEEMASITNEKALFLEAIHFQLTQHSVEIIQQRQAMAMENSWENRVEQLSVIIEHSLSKS